MLPGLKAALNYHPMFVHFPIVLWLAALLFEIFAIWRSSDEVQRMASRMLYLGTLRGSRHCDDGPRGAKFRGTRRCAARRGNS